MAGDFLRSHGIDIDVEMRRIQFGTEKSDVARTDPSVNHRSVTVITNASLPHTNAGSRWDVHLSQDSIAHIEPHGSSMSQPRGLCLNAGGALLAPSLCHPHVHLDKAFLLSHPKYAHLQIERGDFAEAMELTGKAKAQFERDDLLERGQRLIDESVQAGVTYMRAFVELDAGVGTKCLEAGLELKQASESSGRCIVQLCAFAQLPLFSKTANDPEGSTIRQLMEDAAKNDNVAVLGSTPYVESDRAKMERNVDWLADLAIKHNKHLDLHLDYNIDPNTAPLVWHVISTLQKKHWVSSNPKRTVVLGHCTRLCLLPPAEWRRLKDEIGDLPISFVGLPTSDLFMMRTDNNIRGTLDVPSLIKDYGLNACIGINNIGNAFTPYGTCDPLTLACSGVGLYQAGTKHDASLLYECISTRARQAIGLVRPRSNENLEDGMTDEAMDANLNLRLDHGSLLLFGTEKEEWKTRKTVTDVVYLYDSCQGRRAWLNGEPCV